MSQTAKAARAQRIRSCERASRRCRRRRAAASRSDLTAAAARGRLALQVCRDCGAVQYPPREVCRACLSHRLVWRPQDGRGELLTETVLRTAQELYFRERLPWRVGIVRLDAGVNVVAYMHAGVGAAPCRVRVEAALDRAGQAALIAIPEQGRPNLSDDPKLREMTCDPRRPQSPGDRWQVVRSGRRSCARLAAAGADMIWIGEAEPWKKIAAWRRCASCRRRPSFRSTSPTAARCASLPARSAARSILWSTRPIIIALSRSLRAAASKPRNWKWT